MVSPILLLTVIFSALVKFPPSKAQRQDGSCSGDAQPIVRSLDPPSGTTKSGVEGLSTTFTITGETLDQIKEIRVYYDAVMLESDGLTGNSSRVRFQIETALLGSGTNATMSITPLDPDCLTTNLTIALYPQLAIFPASAVRAQPGTALFFTGVSCLPGECGDNSTTFDVVVGGVVLERLDTLSTSLKFAGRFPNFRERSASAPLQIMTQYQVFTFPVFLHFELSDPQSIDSVMPSTGQRGTNVTITLSGPLSRYGSDIDISRVRLGNSNADVITSMDTTTISVRARTSLPGTGSVLINTTDTYEGVSFDGPYTSLENGWVQMMDGTITEIIPQAAQVGQIIRMCGNSLLGGGTSVSAIEFGSVPLILIQTTPLTSVPPFPGSECIEAQIPAMIPSSNENSLIITSDTGSMVESVSNFTVSVIESIVPRRGQILTVVTIRGQGLLSGYNSTPVVFLSRVLATVLQSTNSEIIVRAGVPNIVMNGVMGSIEILVSNPFNSSIEFGVSSDNAWQYEESGQITEANPNFGQYGTLIVITGTNLLAYGSTLTHAMIGPINATVLDGASNTIVQLIVPDTDMTGVVDIVLYSDTGASVRGSSMFQYRERGVILSVSSSQGQNGTYVTIFGTNLSGHGSNITSVRFGEIPATIDYSTTGGSDTTIEVRVQGNNNSDDTIVSITIISSTSAIVTSANPIWTFLVEGQINRNQPQEGQAGTRVEISGTNLLGGGATISEIFLDGVSGTVLSNSTTNIIIVMDDLQTRRSNFYPGEIFIMSDTGAVVSGGMYMHRTTGTISNFSPTRGRRGTIITIVGTDLLGFGANVSSVVTASVTSTIVSYSNNMVIVRAGTGSTNQTGPVQIMIDTGALIQSAANFTFDEPGIISEITPTEGAEGTGVLVRGSGILPPNVQLTNVTIGGIPVSRVVTQSNQEISIIVGPAPPTDADNATVLITASDGSFIEVLSFSFINYAILLPDISSGLEGTVIEITLPSAPQFEPTLTLRITIDDQQADIMSIDTNRRRIMVSVPRARRHGTYTADVAVEGMNGIIARLRDGFTYLPEGTICIITPMQGQVNTNITLQGEYLLGGGRSVVSALVAGQPAIVMQSSNEVVILQLMPNGTDALMSYPQQGDITLTADTGGVVRRLNAFTLVTPGNITQVNPQVGQNGTRVNITGTNLLEGNLTVGSVTLAGIAATIVGSPTNTLILVEAAPSSVASPRPLPVVITLSSGASISSGSGVTFQYLTPGVISTVQPNSGTVGTIVIISGSGLLQGGTTASQVLLGGIPTMINMASNTVINVTVRTGVPTSGGDVVIISDTGSTLVGESLWNYEALGNITSISPPIGQQGIVVTIRGTSLLASSDTRFTECILAGIRAQVVIGQFSANRVQCRAGINPSGRMNLTGPVQLTTDTGVTIISSQNDTFTYYTAFIDSISPTQGNNGTEVVIRGTNLFSDPNGSHQVSRILLGTVPVRVVNATASEIRAVASLSANATLNDVLRVESTSETFLELPNAWNYTTPGQIFSLDPELGLPGYVITLYGDNLVPDGVTIPRVILGQTEAFDVRVINASTIQFRAGIYEGSDEPDEDLPVQVISPTGETVFNSSIVFRYNVTAARVSSISPTSGSEGSVVVISGTNLPNSSSILNITLAGILAVITSAESSEIVVRALGPPLSGVSGQIGIETTDGLFGLAGNAWEYFPVITRSDVSPLTGQNGTIVTINLSRISDLPTINRVCLLNVTALILGVNDSILMVQAGPSGSTPVGNITVQLADNITITIYSAWSYQSPIIVNDISPRSGYFNTLVTIDGSEFPDDAAVYLAGILTVIESQSTTQIRVRIAMNTITSNLTGPVTIITANNGMFYSSEQLTFTYIDVQVSNVSPSSGTRGTLVTLTGVGLLAGGTTITSVTIGGIQVMTIQNSTSNSVRFTAGPSATGSDSVNITYFMDTGARVDVPSSWRYTNPGSIASVTPSAGAMGTIVSVSGNNLFGGGRRAVSVVLNSRMTTDILENFDNFIQVIASEGDLMSQQPGNIQIISDTQAITESDVSVQFTYLPPGIITFFAPTSGQNGTNITITGEGLHNSEGVASVILAGVEARITSVVDTNTLTSITIEAGRPTDLGSFEGPIVITSLRNTTTISAQNFTYLTEGIVFSVTPDRGQNGTIVSIDGENILGGGTTLEAVVLAGIEAAIINQTSSRVVVRSPASSNSITGNIVLVSDTNAHVTRIDGWSYVQQGVIDSISPAEGQYGTRVTITGQNLLSGGTFLSRLQFGNISLDSIITATDNLVLARVTEPGDRIGFTTQSVTLISDFGGVLYLAFNWDFRNQSNITSITPPNGFGETTVIINGTNLLGSGSTILSATAADITANVTSSSNDQVVIRTGRNTNGEVLIGPLILTSDTGALTVATWSYDEECTNNTYGIAGNCLPCDDECNGCVGPTDFNCTECENFGIVEDNLSLRCVPMCPNVSSSDGNLCMDTCELHQYAQVDTTSNVTFCYNCSDLCDPNLGCSGPEPSQCQGCRFFRDVVNQTCIEVCPRDAYYINESKECRPCHPQCSGGCFGPSDTECLDCANLVVTTSSDLSNDACRETCPSLFYLDSRNNYCFPCDSSCSVGCDGPTPFDCTECRSVFITYPNGTRMCMPSCNPNPNALLRYQDTNNACQPCSDLCLPAGGCNGSDSLDCISCNLYQDGVCVRECLSKNAYFIRNSTRTCEMCDPSCGNGGCTEASPGNCLKQSSFSAGSGTVALVIIIILILIIIVAVLVVCIFWRFRHNTDNYKLGMLFSNIHSTSPESHEEDTTFSSKYIKKTQVQSIPLASIEENKTSTNPLYNKDYNGLVYTEMGPEGMDESSCMDVLYSDAEPDETPLPEKNLPISASQDLYTDMNVISPSSPPMVEEVTASQDVYTDMEPILFPREPAPAIPPVPPKPETTETKKAEFPLPLPLPKKIPLNEDDKPPIPEKTAKPPPPGPPSGIERSKSPPKLYTDMQGEITEVFINTAATQDDVYDDVTDSSAPIIDDTYEDTDTIIAALEDYRKSFGAGTKRHPPVAPPEPVSRSFKKRRSAPALPLQPIPKRLSSGSLPRTPLQKLLSESAISSPPTSPTFSDAGIPMEESLYDDITGLAIEAKLPPPKSSKAQSQKKPGKLWPRKK